jgi:hypothetical protein
MAGSNGPSGEHLLLLMRNSDGVFEFALRRSRRPAALSNQRLADIRNSLLATAELLADVLDRQKYSAGADSGWTLSSQVVK